MPTCPTGKKPIDSLAYATRAAHRMKNRSSHPRAYRCKACGLWHVGTGTGKSESVEARLRLAAKRDARIARSEDATDA